MPGNLRDQGPTPPDRTPVDPTPVRAAAPGRRLEVSSDARITSRIERSLVDPTPPPLPPSPAAADAARWLARARANAESSPAIVAPASVPSVDLTAPVPHAGRAAWIVPLLLAVTALAVGMVLGALLFGGRTTSCPPERQGVQGSISPTSSSRADDVTALYTAIDRWSA